VPARRGNILGSAGPLCILYFWRLVHLVYLYESSIDFVFREFHSGMYIILLVITVADDHLFGVL
jgi:hypothetical protein